MYRHAPIALALLVLFAACARGEVTRADWKGLSTDEKTVIIESFRGHEAARDAKGGTGRLHTKSTEYYRDRIDELYRSGDERTVAEIWESFVEEKPVVTTTE